MNYSKKLEIFLANLQIKLDRIERPHCIASKANITAFYKHSNKMQCRYELDISAKSNRTKIYCHLSVVVNQLTSIVYH